MRYNYSDVNTDIEKWNLRYDNISKALIWIYFMEYAILLIATSVIIVIVVFIRKRTDFFVLSTLSCYLVSSIMLVTYSIYFYSMKPDMLITWLEVVQQFGRFCYMMGHWAFSA